MANTEQPLAQTGVYGKKDGSPMNGGATGARANKCANFQMGGLNGVGPSWDPPSVPMMVGVPGSWTEAHVTSSWRRE